MDLEEAGIEEEGLGGSVTQELDRLRGHLLGVRITFQDLVVADRLGLPRNMLHADQRGVVPGAAQRMDEVLLVVVEPEAPVGQPEHATGMGRLSGQEGGAAGGAGRGGAERLSEQHPLLGQALDARRGHGVAIRLDVPAGVMRMQIDNVWQAHSALPTSP